GTERRCIKLVSSATPIGQVLIHQAGEPLAVVAFEVVRHLMDDDVFQAVGVLLSEFDVEPDVPRLAVTGAPLSLHATDRPLRHGHVEYSLPPTDEIRNRLAKLVALPLVEVTASLLSRSVGGHV